MEQVKKLVKAPHTPVGAMRGLPRSALRTLGRCLIPPGQDNGRKWRGVAVESPQGIMYLLHFARQISKYVTAELCHRCAHSSLSMNDIQNKYIPA